jgi:hypothetical protein
MGFFRFRRSIKILPGVRWNLNKGGSSLTFGGRGYRHTIGSKGSRTTVGIPGTGISYTQVHSSGAKPPGLPPPLPSTQMPPTSQKRGMNKAGWLYAAGLTVIGIWLLSFLSNLQTPAVTRQSAPSASPTLPVSSPLAVRPVPAPTFAPEPSVTIMRAARVRSAAEETRLKKFIPARVRLRQDLEFRATSQNATIPSVHVGQGREVNVVKVNGSELVVEHGGWQATVPVSKTDFLDRVIAEAEK